MKLLTRNKWIKMSLLAGKGSWSYLFFCLLYAVISIRHIELVVEYFSSIRDENKLGLWETKYAFHEKICKKIIREEKQYSRWDQYYAWSIL